MDVRVLLAALICGVAKGQVASFNRIDNYWHGYAGGNTLTIYGENFSEDSFNYFDPEKGNIVQLVNEFDVIDCKINKYLSSTKQIVCSTGRRTKTTGPRVYQIKVYVDGVEASGSKTIQYGPWVSPRVDRIEPLWSFPGEMVTMYGYYHTDRYIYPDVTNMLDDDLDSGLVLTKSYLGNVDCNMINSSTEALYGSFTISELTCLPKSLSVGPKNGSVYVTQRGASATDRNGVYIDSQDKLYQHHTYPGVNSVSPSSGSPWGRTLMTVEGVGFNPYFTEVFVGGAICEIQTITDNQLTCLTPAQDETSPGPRERGALLELWENESSVNIHSDDEWATLDSNHENYTVQSLDDLLFDLNIAGPSVGKISGYLNLAHGGQYAIALAIEDTSSRIYIATDGNPDNAVRVNHWEIFDVIEGVQPYFYVRIMSQHSTPCKFYMNDFTTNHTSAQSTMAHNEKHRIRLNPAEAWDKTEFRFSGPLTTAYLDMNGFLSDPVDVTDVDQVRSAIFGLVEQKCEFIALDVKSAHTASYESDSITTSARGDIADDVEPFCGRRVLKTYTQEPRLYQEGDRTKMVDMLTYPYMCMALMGNIQSTMILNVYWKDKWNRWRNDHIAFEHGIVASADSWTYACVNLKEFTEASWIGSNRNEGNTLLVKRAFAPPGADEFGELYVDEFGFFDQSVDVQQRRPSALKPKGILVRDVNVEAIDVTSVAGVHSSFSVEFITSNCRGEFPLVGVSDGVTPVSANYGDSASFLVNGEMINVTRVITATNPVGGTWALNIEGVNIEGISPTVTPNELDDLIEAAIGSSGIKVSTSGTCDNFKWEIEWTDNPGRKEVGSVDGSALTFDGDSVDLSISRYREGKSWHDPIRADFLNVWRDDTSVSVKVHGYSASCVGDCSYEFSGDGVPTLSSVAGSVDGSGSHSFTIIGTDFSSSDSTDYSVWIGSEECTDIAVTSTTQITCSVSALPSGVYEVTVVMQPIGAAQQPTRAALTYVVSQSITSLSISTGGTGGGYPLQVFGSGFPSDIDGWMGSSVALGATDCNIITADATSVTCMVSAGSAGSVDVVLELPGGTITSVNGFTYDASLSASFTAASPTTSSVTGGDTLTISGSDFGVGTDGYVKVGPNACNVSSWSDTEITCTIPVNNPGQHDVSVYTDSRGFASGSASVTYTFKVTGSSGATGSVGGGTIMVIDGEGFGTDCTQLKVEIGDAMECQVMECSDTQITCITRLVSTNHVITNKGLLPGYGEGFAWSPKTLTIRAGDSVTWSWSPESVSSQLTYNVFQTDSATSSTYDGTGFNSGTPVAQGATSVVFNVLGAVYYSGDPVYIVSPFDNVVMKGQINVVAPREEVNEVRVKIGEVEADYEPQGASSSVSVAGCSPLLSTPFVDCNSTAPTAPDSDQLYFISDLCLSPTVVSVTPSGTETIPGLPGVLVRSGVTLTITGNGFGTDVCQTSVSVGPASCTVTATSDTSVTCDLDDYDNIISLKAYPVAVTVANRGSAYNTGSNFELTVVPVVSSFTPTEGSTGGGTLITISGSGLESFDGTATVSLGSSQCDVQDVTASAITCLTAATPASAVTLSVTVSNFNIAPISDLAISTYTFSEAATPTITGIVYNDDGTVTLSGSLFGSSVSDVTVTLNTAMQARNGVQKPLDNAKEEEIMREIDDTVYYEDIDEELHAYYEEEMPEARSLHRPKVHSLFSKKLHANFDFWSTFTKTNAKTFEESKTLGAWRIAGSDISRTSKDLEIPEEISQTLFRQIAQSSYSCSVTSVTNTAIVCNIANAPANNYVVSASVGLLGSATFSGVSGGLTVVPLISSISPTEGSIHGGALLEITGSRFTVGDVSVSLGGFDCPLESETDTSLNCRVPSNAAGDVTVEVTSASVIGVSGTDFTYSTTKTPVITSVSPDTGLTSGMTLTVTGTDFILSGSDPTVTVDGSECTIVSSSDVSITCQSPNVGGGPRDVVVEEAVYGYSNSYSVTYDFSLAAVTPAQGGFGGIEVVVSGFGFDPNGGSDVTVCGFACTNSGTVSSSSITCIVPPYTGSLTSESCDVVVTNPDMTMSTDVGGFTYESNLTPDVTMVTPKRGGTAGGTTVTIDGTGFASSGNTITIGGSECLVSTESATQITCVTEAHSGPGVFSVVVDVPGSGFATTDDNGEFFYIDRWSSIYTWAGEPVPSEGQLVVIEEGQTILLDESTEVIKAIIIEGGHLVFDDEASEEIVLRAEYILIVNGGSLSIGSEEDPFMNDAVIELHGNTRSIELPFYGAKVLAVRNGTLDIHGAPIATTWTRLSTTALAGDTTLSLTTPVDWKAGDRIVLATTEHRFVTNENEELTIDSVSADGLTVTLTEALEYEHTSIQQTLGGRVVETRAEVGLLTRNVKIRGNINQDFTKVIAACDDTWMPDQFDTQSCFTGRFGEEIGSDQFGAVVMLFGKYPNQDLVEGRIEYVEVTEAGQAFQLGRYPLHFHLVGDVSTSYIRGCAIHRTYNRAVTIHAADQLTVSHNVAYNIMGQTFFTEDGNEQGNVIEYNLAVFTRSSSSLLNVDITPASYWVVHPNNIVRHNAAAGGTHFGYWYRLEKHPTGPSATNDICQNNAPMGEFSNNTAHSMGRYGLWIFSMDGYFPKTQNCGGSDTVAVWNSFTVWRCDRGAEVVFGGALQFNDFVALDNENAGLEMVKVKGEYGDSGPGIFNSLVVGHSALSDGSCADGASGIIAPKQYVFNIADTTFVNFDTGTCSALSGCSQCKVFQGGFPTQVKGLTFDNVSNKLKWKWEHEAIWIDSDGSLSGTAENVILPSMGILPPSNCQFGISEFSVSPDLPGAVCSGLKFLRTNIKGPSIEPTSLQGRDFILANNHGNTTIPYRVKRLTTEGWMGILFTEETYNWSFDYSNQLSNVSFEQETRLVEGDDYYYMSHQFTQRLDSFGTLGEQSNSTDGLPDPDIDGHGAYYYDNDTRTMTYMVSGTVNPGRADFNTRELGDQRDIDFEVYRCFYEQCITPTPPPVPTGRPDVTLRWSDTETWKDVPVGSGGHPTEDTWGLPVEGDEIIIPQGMWLIVDIATPSLGRVYVYGTIEFEDVMDHTFDVSILYIQGGNVIGGFSEDAPFTNNLNIVLRGSLDPTDPDNEDMPMPFGVPAVGWKAIGVFGQLTLHGEPHVDSWVRLGATATAGDSTLTLEQQADSTWLNKEVMITTTSKESKETEVRTVTAVSGFILTLDSALAFDHMAVSFTLSDGTTSFTMAAEVGVLTNNIVIEGNDYPDLEADSFGGRVIVSKLNSEGVDYVGQAQLSAVEFRNMGQEGFSDVDDPRYSLAFVGLGVNDGSNYVKRCSFNKNYNTAIGLFGTDNITVEENVIYHTVGPCIRDDSNGNSYLNNLLSVMLFPGTYNGRNEVQNLHWYGAFALNKATNSVLDGNIVAGSEQAGYHTPGELCDSDTLWSNNEVHGSLYGVMAWIKGGGSSGLECRRLSNVYAWRVWDTAFYMQSTAEFLIIDVQAVDCQVGVNQISYSPPSLSHIFVPKRGRTENSIFVGASPYHTCDYQESKADIYSHKIEQIWKGVQDRHIGVVFTSFQSGPNMAPKHGFHVAESYPALYGSTIINNVIFAHYTTRSCGDDRALGTNPTGDDAIHPIFTSQLTFLDTPSDNKLYFHKPNLGVVNPSDCVDMDCDGLKKVVVTDTDGSLLGTANATVTSEAEFEWDQDPSRGVGDYRIPVALKQNLDGSEIDEADKFPNKGIVRDESCSFVAAWRAWKCMNLRHRMMVIESMDSDTEIRRLSPIALIANPGSNGYVDLLNGPMDRGWCFGYTCQERISTFYSIVASGVTYEMAMTSTPPQVLRFHLLESDASETVLLRIYYPKTQRFDIYVDDVYVAPTNIDNSASSYQLLAVDPNNPDAFFPDHSDVVGTNYIQREEKFLHVLLRGGHIIDIKTSPTIILSTGLVIDPNNFFEENIVQNVAAMLGISPQNIRIAKIIREDSVRRGTTETAIISFEIGSAPTESLESGNATTGGDVMSREDLEKSMAAAVNAFQSGRSSEYNLDITDLEVTEPIKEPEVPSGYATEDFGSQEPEGAELYSQVQQEQEQEELEISLTPKEYDQPSEAVLRENVPGKVTAYTLFSNQPVISALSTNGSYLENLGYESDPWQIEAYLKESSTGTLGGTTLVPYENGSATFTDLWVDTDSPFTMGFHVAYPEEAPSLTVSLGYQVSVNTKKVLLKVADVPACVNYGEDFSIALSLNGRDTGLPMEPTVLTEQILQGKVKQSRRNSINGELGGPQSITVTGGDISEFIVGGLHISKPSSNKKKIRESVMEVRAAIEPAGWVVSTPKIRVKVMDDCASAITTKISMKGLGGRSSKLTSKDMALFKTKLVEEIRTEIGRAYWDVVTVKLEKRPFAIFEVSGSEEQVTAAINSLCKSMRKKNIKVRMGRQRFSMGRLRVDGRKRSPCY